MVFILVNKREAVTHTPLITKVSTIIMPAIHGILNFLLSVTIKGSKTSDISIATVTGTRKIPVTFNTAATTITVSTKSKRKIGRAKLTSFFITFGFSAFGLVPLLYLIETA